MKQLIYTRFDYFEDEMDMYACDISDVEFRTIALLTPEFLYNWVKANSVGIITPSGSTKFVARFEFGNISLSLQVAYYLWSKRDDEMPNYYHYTDLRVMKKEEWDKLVPNIHSTIDVQVECGNDVIIEPTQLNFVEVVAELQQMICHNKELSNIKRLYNI